MRHLLILLLLLPGCPPPDDPDPIFVPPTQEIGTWPTPEMDALGEERCDGLDNDGDGSVDEGCSCTENRGCVLVTDEQTCLAGTQICANGLGECTGPGTDLGAAIDPSIIVTATPTTLTPLDATGPLVTATVVASCPGIAAPYVLVLLEAEVPAMRVWAVARDDGVAPDVGADDGVYTTELINPFGPGVASQTMTIEAGVRLNEAWILDQASVDYQAD